MFSKILIANRGEIAVRIIRACKEMGIGTVAVFSEADRDALHVSMADESVCIGPAPVKDSYLNISAILTAAVQTGAQAVHPGYGLLSENARFAELCESCNLTFIGPGHKTISLMGDKDAAKKLMAQSGIPVIPGSDIITDMDMAEKEARRIGFPLLIKARSGGGGRGIRLVNSIEEVRPTFLAAQTEAANAFGDGACFLEKFVSPVKHVEMQVIVDNYGNVVCLGERDCSVQRKNQKIIEESPCAVLPESTRQRMMEASIKAVEASGYRGVGTIEYLLDKDNNFYFLEMNTRLQVEHPVTEMVTGIDLVKWQIRVAAGLKLEFTQQDVTLNGSAIECRINAENPAFDFKPSCGKIELLHIPGGPWVRFDTSLYQGYVIPPYYDSMMGKLIVHAKTRAEAIRKMQAALCELVIEGVDNNIDLLIEILDDEEFKKGTYSTGFMKKRKWF